MKENIPPLNFNGLFTSEQTHIFRRFFFPVALPSFRTLTASHIGGFLNYLDIW
jgi:hypothetical protein